MAINVFPAEKRAKGTIGGYWDTPLSVQNAGKALKSPKRGLRGTVYCCYTVPLAYLLSAAWTPATERSVYGQSCPEGLEDRSNQPRKEKAMEALRRSQRHRVPTGVEMPDRRCGPAGNGPRAEADGLALGVSSGGRSHGGAPTPSLSGPYRPPPAAGLAPAGISNALPRIFAFCETE